MAGAVCSFGWLQPTTKHPNVTNISAGSCALLKYRFARSVYGQGNIMSEGLKKTYQGSLLLFYLKLCEHTLVESEADIDAEGVLRNHGCRVTTHPLCRDIEHRAVVVVVDDWDAQAQ